MHLARAGYDVEVICGSDPYAPVEGDPGEDPERAGVRIRRLSRLFGGDIHRRKLLRQLWFYAAALPQLLFRRSPAVFVTQTNPPLIVAMVAFAAALHGRPFVIIAMDLYPEVLIVHGALGPQSLAARLLRTIFGWAYRRAARVVSLGPVMSQRLVEKGVPASRIVEISNWATGEEVIVRGADNRLRDPWQLAGCFTLLYSGNLGIAHDVETPIRAVLHASRKVPRLRLLFVGKGSRLEEAKRLTAELGAGHVVQFHSLVPMELLPHSLGLADLALVTLRPGFEGLVVPSKLLGYLARGVPSIYVGPPSDAQRLIDAAGAGACVNGGAVDRLAQLLEHLADDAPELARMQAAAANYYERELSRPHGLDRYRQLLDALTDRKPVESSP